MLKLLGLIAGGLKLGKVFGTGTTMLISVVAYAFVFGWPYAVGFVLLLLAHEMGHFIAARRRGLAVGAPTFIPFVGAWVELKDMPVDAETEAYVGLGGPVLGTLAALGCWLLANEYDSRLLLALAYAGCMLNLFNLIPVSPFDGGRITGVLSPRIWLLGVPVLIWLFVHYPSPMLILVAFLAYPAILEAWRGIRSPEQAAYYSTPLGKRIEYGTLYLGLVGFLASFTHDLHLQLERQP